VGKKPLPHKINRNEVFCYSIGTFQPSRVIHVNESCAYSVREHKLIAHEEIRTNSRKTPDEIKPHKSDPIIDFRTMLSTRENFASVNEVVKGDPILGWEFWTYLAKHLKCREHGFSFGLCLSLHKAERSADTVYLESMWRFDCSQSSVGIQAYRSVLSGKPSWPFNVTTRRATIIPHKN